MRFSLVMATLKRPEEVKRFLAALDLQTYRDFELIVVDQDVEDVLSPVLAPFIGKFTINHIRLGKSIGCVNARNMGAKAMTGDVLAFPDDDCWYNPDCLERVATHFAKHPDWDGITTRVFNQRYYSRRSGPVTKLRAWWQGLEFTLFYRKKIVDKIGLMDPSLGPASGTPWGAGEGADYILRAIEAGFYLYYDASIEIHHPGPIVNKRDDKAEAKCIYRYSVGKGHVLYEHEYPLWYVAYMMARPLVGGFVSLLKLRPRKTLISLAVPRGVFRGYVMSIRHESSAPTKPSKPTVQRA